MISEAVGILVKKKIVDLHDRKKKNSGTPSTLSDTNSMEKGGFMCNDLVTQAAQSVATFVCTGRLPYLAASYRRTALFNHAMIVGGRAKDKISAT